MRNFLLTVALLAGFSVVANAQTSKSSSVKGTNPNPDAPVNVADPALRPANPATYSATEVPGTPGRFYVKDDKPATSDFRVIEPSATPQPSKEDLMRKAAATQGASAPQKAATSPAAGGKAPAKKSAK